jgi:hypothetical protein
MADCVFFWGGGRGTKLRPPRRTPSFVNFDCRLFIVHRFRCNSRAPPQESPHRDEDAGEGLIATPPPPRTTAAPAASPATRRGSSSSSPPRCSCRTEPQRSTTWPMINAAGCGAKSSPSGGAVVPVRGHARRRRPGPGGPPCGGVTKGAAPGSGVGGGGGGGGAGFAAQPPSS